MNTLLYSKGNSRWSIRGRGAITMAHARMAEALLADGWTLTHSVLWGSCDVSGL